MNQASGEMSGSGGDVEGGDDQEESSSSPKSTDALEEFRKEWKRELESSPQHVVKQTTRSSEAENIPHNVVDKATTYFKLGIEHEEKGKMYEAIQYYRRAVQLYPDIEFHIFQGHAQSAFPEETHIDEDNEVTYAEEDVEGEVEEEEFDPEKTDLLTHLQLLSLRQQRRSLCFPHLPTNATHISALPMEVFLYILRWVVSSELDVRSLEMCSKVCRGFYVCCRDPEIWRSACMRVWGVKSGNLSSEYPTWRDMFIRRPRLHFGGCYIAKTTYIRHGENSFQDQFYRPWHLVEYYRYLRFFSDGRVLMLTTPEAPTSCVGLLKRRVPPARKPPILSGYFRLHETIVSIVVTPSIDRKSTRSYSNFVDSHTFHLELEILSHKKALHGQLAWRGYSVFTQRGGIETNTSFDLVAQRYPPFWYSRVKSYMAETKTPV
uniref:F-box only protein 9 n=1 Tax=Lygus hesperus TaxID=30085 RepID=A0A0A9XGR1_LYGHE